MNDFKVAAIKAGEDSAILKSSMISPIKNKRSGDKKPRSRRLKGALPPSDQTDEFKRASLALNFEGHICAFFDLLLLFSFLFLDACNSPPKSVAVIAALTIPDRTEKSTPANNKKIGFSECCFCCVPIYVFIYLQQHN